MNSKDVIKQFNDYIGVKNRLSWVEKWSKILTKRSKDDFVRFFNMNIVSGTYPYGLSNKYVIISSNDSIRNVLAIGKSDIEMIKNKSVVEQNKFIYPGSKPDMIKTFDYIENKYIYIDFHKFTPIVGIEITETNSESITNFLKGISKING